jgi:hypothetical protein
VAKTPVRATAAVDVGDDDAIPDLAVRAAIARDCAAAGVEIAS